MRDDIQTNPGPTSHTITNLPQDHTKRQRQYLIPNKKPQLSITTKWHNQLHPLILQCGDIHPNPGPMPDLLQTHPPPTKEDMLIQFGFSLKVKLFIWIKNLEPTHFSCAQRRKGVRLNFNRNNNTYPKHLNLFSKNRTTYIYKQYSCSHTYITTYNNTNHPPPMIIYALIVTINPSIEICNIYLQHPPTQNWTSQLLETMATLPNPPEGHITIPHPYTQFHNVYIDTITPLNTIHKKLYDYLHLNTNTLSIQNMSKTFHTYQGNY